MVKIFMLNCKVFAFRRGLEEQPRVAMLTNGRDYRLTDA